MTATFKRITSTNPVAQRQSLQQRVRRRLMPIFMLLVLAAAVPVFALPWIREREQLSIQRADVLATLSEDVNDLMARAVTDLSGLAASSFVRAYNDEILQVEDPVAPPARLRLAQRDMLRALADLVTRNPERYLGVSFVTREGGVWGEVINANGQVTLDSNYRALPGSSLDDAYRAIITDRQTSGVRFAAIDFDNSAVRIYVPVPPRSGEAPGGILAMDVNLLAFNAPLRRVADQTTTLYAEERAAVLLNSRGQVIAVSDTGRSFDVERAFLNQTPGQFTDQSAGPLQYSTTLIEPYTGVDLPWRLALIDNTGLLFASVTTFSLVALAAIALLIVILLAVLDRVLFNALRPLESAFSTAAQRLTTTEVPKVTATQVLRAVSPTSAPAMPSAPPSEVGDGQVDSLMQAIEGTTQRIAGLVDELDNQTRRRARDIDLAARIGRETAQLVEIDQLVNRAIQFIILELGVYHAQVFLLDDLGQNAVLSYSHGEAGRRLLEAGHRLRVGSDTVVGRASGTKQAVVVNDTRSPQARHGFNALLPDTRAELALPLIVGDRVIGVLDIQSAQPEFFLDEDLPVYGLLADQLAVAINKAQLIRQSQQRIDQIDLLNRQLTQAAWDTFEDNQPGQFSYVYNLSEVKPSTQPRIDLGNRGVVMPINVRGETIGEIIAETPPDEPMTENHRNLLRAVADRVALAVENARLFTESQNSLAETRTLYQFSSALNEAESFNDILKAMLTTVVADGYRSLLLVFNEFNIEDGLPPVALVRGDYVNPDMVSDQAPALLNGVDYDLTAFPFIQRFDPTSPLLIEDSASDHRLDPSTRALMQNIGIGAAAFIPLYVREQWLGVALLGFNSARTFTPREQRLIPLLMNPLSIATDNRLLTERNEQTSQLNASLYAAGRNITTAATYEDLVGAALATTTDYDDLSFSLALLEGEPDEGGWPTFQRVVGYTDQADPFGADFRHRIRITPDSPMRSREPEVVVDDGTRAPEIAMRVPWLPDPTQIKSMAVYPLLSAGIPIALFYVTSKTARPVSESDDSVYRAITGQMSVQLQNRRLLETTAEARDDNRRLYVASRAISSAQQLEDIYATTADHLSGPALAAVREGEQDLRIMVWIARPDPSSNPPLFEMVHEWSNSGQPSRILDEGRRTFWTRDEMPLALVLRGTNSLVMNVTDSVDPNTPQGELASVLHANGAAAALLAPVESHGYWFGVLVIHTDRPEALNERYVSFVEATASQLGLALENKMLFNQTEAAVFENATLYQASRALSNATSSADVLGILVNNVLPPDFQHVFVVELQGQSWDAPGVSVNVVAEWVPDGTNIMKGTILQPDEFPGWNMISSPDVIMMGDTQSDAARVVFEARNSDPMVAQVLDARALVIIPLRVQSRIIGAIWISSQFPHTFSDRSFRIFQSFGEQASLSLDATRLLEQTNRRAQQLQTSAEVSSTASQILELDQLMPRLVDLIKTRFNYDHAQIFLMDDNDDYAELRASTGEPGKKLLSVRHKLKKGSASVIGQVVAEGRPIIASDTADAEVVHAPNPFLPDTRSELALPLFIKGRVVGALDVQSNNPNAFTPDDISALTTLAAQISVAIENANLYEEAQAQAKRMGMLFDITTSAAAATTVTDALQRVADSLFEELAPRLVLVYVKQLYADPLGNTFEALDAAAFAGFNISLDDAPRIRLAEKGGGMLGEVARTRRLMLIPDIPAEASYQRIVPNAASALIVPLVGAGEVLGLIVMEGTTRSEFGPETVQLVQTLAGSLSAVIQNAQFLDRLTRANEELRELDKLKSDFLANMSHELRTPLNSIIGFSRMMLKGMSGQLSEMQEQDLSTIFNSGNHLLTVINDILDQAKITAGKMTVSIEEFDLKPELEAVKSIGLGLVKDKPIDLRMEISPNLPRVYGDKVRVRQVMLNLVSNASKFTKQGTVQIRAYPVNEGGMQWIRVDVIDSGIGIAEQDMPLLFEPFRQVDSSLTRTAGGTGLGLPIARSLMQLMGGALTVQSTLNVGSTFTITIPTEPVIIEDEDDPLIDRPVSTMEMAAVPSDARPVAPPMMMTPPPMDAKRQVMVVEDNPDMVDQYRRTLQRQGFEVIVASSMLEARAIAPALQPTVIIMDVDFDNGGGWELLEELHQREDTADIPIVIATLNEESERAVAAGAFAFLQRPYAPDQLIEAVMRAEKVANIPRILLIDDQDDALKLLGELLRSHGNFRVYTARSGMEGLMQVAFRRPQLVILDLRMPEMDGFAVLNELRQNPETSHIPVMIVTNDDTLKAEEQEKLNQVRVIQKAGISNSEYDSFMRGVNDNLRTS